MGYGFLCEYADVERVMVTLHIVTGEHLVGKLGHICVAVCLRQEAVKARYNVGELLRPVKTEIA